MLISTQSPSIASSKICRRIEMKVRKGVKSAGSLSRRIFLFCALGFAMVAASNAGAAESDSGGLPDSLYWEVSMPTGYVWMNGCGEMGIKKTGNVVAAIIPLPEGLQADAHAGHHPGKVVAQPLLLDVSSLESAIAELSSIVNGNVYISPIN